MIHLSALFFMLQHQESKTRVRHFLTSILALKEPAPSLRKKPKIPLRILSPITQEKWIYEAGHMVPLTANKPAQWRVDQEYIGEGKTVFWPMASGTHFVQAVHEDREQGLYIFIK